MILSAAVSAVSVSVSAAAQGPVQLFPLPPGPGLPAAPPAMGPVLPGPAGIEVRSLGGIDIDTFGLLDAVQGGVGEDLWQGLDTRQAQALLGGIPEGVPSRAMTALARRVLLSTATPPLLHPGESSGSLTLGRAEVLFRLGLHSDLLALLERVPAAARPAAVRRVMVDALLLHQRLDDACASVVAAPPDPRTDDPALVIHAQRVRVLCQARAGEGEAAALSMGMLRETRDADETFLILAERVAGLSQGRLRKPSVRDAVDLVLYREAGEGVPAALLKGAAPWLLRAVALSAPTLPAVRLDAAEQAEARGALPSEALAFLYGDTPLGDAGRRAEDIGSADTPLARAALVQSLRVAPSDPSGAVVVFEAGRAGPDEDVGQATGRVAAALASLRARDPALYLVLARAVAPGFAGLLPTPDQRDAAPEIARALQAGGEPGRASGWLRLIQDGESTRPDHAAALSALMTIDQVATRQTLASTALLSDRLGTTTPEGSGTAAALARLDAAAAQRLRGQTALLALAALGESGGPLGASAPVLARVCAALEAVDLSDDARALALEALIGRSS